jgi:hypothetical protein
MTLTTRMVAVAGLMSMALSGFPAAAMAGAKRPNGPSDEASGPAVQTTATLYELTENMKVVQRNKRKITLTRRVASSALTGLGSPGSPLCPSPDLQSGPAGCAVNVQGRDNISLLTGLGTFSGDFATVIQGDNPVDGPEAVVLRGEFSGQMDFSPAILQEIPFGTVRGLVRPHRGRRTDFFGVFRLPFAGNIEVEVEVQPGVKMMLPLRQIFCPLSPTPNPYAEFYGGFDLAYLDTDVVETPDGPRHVPNGKCLDIQPHELSLGAPLVRFDVTF